MLTYAARTSASSLFFLLAVCSADGALSFPSRICLVLALSLKLQLCKPSKQLLLKWGELSHCASQQLFLRLLVVRARSEESEFKKKKKVLPNQKQVKSVNQSNIIEISVPTIQNNFAQNYVSLVLSPLFPGPLETVFPKSARDFVFFPCLYILLLILLFCLFNVFSELFSLEFVEVFRTGKNLAGDCCFNSCDLAKQTLVNGVFLTNLEINLV